MAQNDNDWRNSVFYSSHTVDRYTTCKHCFAQVETNNGPAHERWHLGMDLAIVRALEAEVVRAELTTKAKLP